MVRDKWVSPLSRSFLMKHTPRRRKCGRSRAPKKKNAGESAVEQTSPAEEKKNMAGFDNCLSPVVGDFELQCRIVDMVFPDMVATRSGSVQVYEGHHFLVQAGVCIGGKENIKQGLNIFRFEKGTPLLFKPVADAVTSIVLERIDWSAYKIDKARDKICVFVCIVGALGTGNEYIATAVESVIRQSCDHLRSKIVVENMLAKSKPSPSTSISYAADAFYDLQLNASKNLSA